MLNAVSQYIIKAFIVAYNTTIIVTKPGIGMNQRKTIKAVKCAIYHIPIGQSTLIEKTGLYLKQDCH